MRFFYRGALLLASLLVWNVSAAPPPGYYLVWNDEFNGTSLDPTKWWVWVGVNSSGYTTPNAVTVTNGYLTINTYTDSGINYTAIISSDARFRERYGYTEASVEFNGSPGMFSDFWVQSPDNTGTVVGNPAAEGMELDICEHRAADASNLDNISGEVTIDLHWDGYTNGVEKTATSGLVGSGLGTGFHTYGLLWNNAGYTVSIDGAATWTTNVGISDRTEFVMFSSQVSSNSFCGIVPTGGYGDLGVSTTSTVVDYVRFYAPTTTLYWIGASSANFSDAGNWLSNMVPASSNDLVFSYLSLGNFNVTLATNTTVNSLSLEETPPLSIGGGTLAVNSGGIDMLSAINNATINSPVVLNSAQSWTIGQNLALIVTSPVSGPGSLTLNGLGEVALEGTNSSSSVTTITSGTLAVYGMNDGPITVAGGTCTGTGMLSGPVTVNSGTLTGTEIITAPVTVNVGGTIAPGSPTGTLTISNSLTLQPGSSTVINLNKSSGAAGQITGLSSITYGGTLVISNQSGVLAAGDTFNVFNAGAYSGAFSRIKPATPGTGLVWDTGTLAQGILHVVSTSNALITAQLTGSQLSLSWASLNLGWLLQTQTNPPGAGLSANWTTVPGSGATNLMLFNINPAVGSVFYRLVSPSFSTAIFGNGDLLVLQVGNGSIASSGAPGVLKDYSPFGGSSQVQVSLPTTGASALIFGASSYEGGLSLSADGHSVVVVGYNVPIGFTSSDIDTSSTTGATPVPRAVGSVTADGKFILAATTTKFSGSTIRSAVTDGAGNFWAGGGSSGVNYLGSNSPAATLSTVATSTRNLLLVNGSIYFTEASPNIGVMAFSGAPITAATPTLILSTAGTGTGTPSPEGFAFNPAMTIAYVADNRTSGSGEGIQRFNWNGSAWVYAYTLVSSTKIYDLAVNFSGPSPALYAITGESTQNRLVTVTDAGAGSPSTTLETAPSGDAFRGIAFAPSP
jgi:hypothetical protein